jgi:hypothetical protein
VNVGERCHQPQHPPGNLSTREQASIPSVPAEEEEEQGEEDPSWTIAVEEAERDNDPDFLPPTETREKSRTSRGDIKSTRKKKQCPECGHEVVHLPKHLRIVHHLEAEDARLKATWAKKG